MNFRIYPYKLASASARRLREALGGRPLLKPDSAYTYQDGDVIINWGGSTEPNFLAGVPRDNFLNHPSAVALAANKLRAFSALSEAGVETIPFTTDPQVAADWDEIYVRHRLTGHSGDGIEIIGVDDEVPEAPLYTKAMQNSGEYRVHVMNGNVFDYRKKSRQRDDEPTQDEVGVRTLENGWVYRQGNLRRLERIESLAVRAVEALRLDFGAVDIIMTEESGPVAVLEVNTACGLADNTLESYITNFRENYARE